MSAKRPTKAERELSDALRAAVAFVELHTGNGVKEQPPEWAADFDAERIAKRAREALAMVTEAQP